MDRGECQAHSASSPSPKRVQLIRIVVFEKYRCPVASECFRHTADNLVEQLLKIEYGIDLLGGLLQEQELTDTPFERPTWYMFQQLWN